MEMQDELNPEQEIVFTDGAVMNQALSGEAIYTNEFGGSRYNSGLEVLAAIGQDPYSTFEMSREAADIIFTNSMIARRAVELVPDKAFSLLKSWEAPDTKNNKDINKLMQVWRKILLSPLIEAGQMARKYQDAYVILFFDDSNDLSVPLDTTKANKLIGALARSRWSINPVQGYPGSATYYTMTNNYADEPVFVKDGQLRNVHKSRIIHVPGLLVDDEQKKLRQGYNMSVFTYLLEPLSQWIGSQHSGIAMLKSHSAFTLGLSGLAWKTSNKDINSLSKRFSSILAGLKRVGGLFYDKDQEDANFISRSYSGVDNLIGQLEGYLLNASDVPKEFLLNSSNSAYSDEGLGSRYAFAEVVERYQRTHINPIIDTLFPALIKIYNLSVQGDLDFYESIYDSALTLTRAEEADIRFKNSQTDTMYLNASTEEEVMVLNSESVRSRWESGHYSDDITLTGSFKKTPPEPTAGVSNTLEVKKETGKLAANAERGAYTKAPTNKKD